MPQWSYNWKNGAAMTQRIEDYALIGDCKSAALIGRDGSIDWLCWPRFDSPACFAALLGNSENGRWLIRPRQAVVETKRSYRPGTLVLGTVFRSSHGSALVTDFMIPGDGAHIVRIVTGLRGGAPIPRRTRNSLRLRCDRPVGGEA